MRRQVPMSVAKKKATLSNEKALKSTRPDGQHEGRDEDKADEEDGSCT